MADPDLLAVALLLTDGQPIDWDARASGAGPDERRLLVRLQQLEALAAVHGTVAPGTAATTFDSIRAQPDAAAETKLRWGSLEILEKVGRGSYGDVYRARDTRLGRDVALKLLRQRDDEAAAASEMIEEGHLLARVRHPNVVTVHGAERIDGRAGLWMEFISGETLEDELRRRGPLPSDDVVRVGLTLGDALAAVHAAGLLHRDVKAQNVMRDTSGRIVLMDFGTGRDASSGDTELAGTPLYLAPEVLAGQPPSERSDVYALGVLLWRLATGAFPVQGGSVEALRRAHAARSAARAAPTPSAMSPALGRVVQRAIDPDPLRRYASVEGLRSALQHIASPPQRHRGYVLATAALAIVVAGLAVAAAMYSRGPASVRARLGFNARDYVLVAQFENATGEAGLERGLALALERALSESTALGLVSASRVQDTLHLLKRPPDTTLHLPVAVEVARRDGHVKLILAGSVARRGESFLVATDLVDPIGQTVVARLSEPGRTREGIVDAVDRLAVRIRVALGDSAATGRPGGRVASGRTPSALGQYAASYALSAGGKWREAIEPARAAVRDDPGFASGWIWLAWCLERSDGPAGEVRAAAERAVQLAPQLPDWERNWIMGSYYMLLGASANSISHFEALVRLRPDHEYGLNNLINALTAERRGADLAAITRIAADHRPHSPEVNFIAAASTISSAQDVAGAMPYVERARAAFEAAGSVARDTPNRRMARLWLRLLPCYLAWRSRDIEAMRKHVDAASALARLPDDSQPPSAAPYTAAQFNLSLGRLRQADALIAGMTDEFNRSRNAVAVALAAENVLRLRQALRKWERFSDHPMFERRATHYLRADLVADARAFLDSDRSRRPTSLAIADLARGELALIDGDAEAAVQILTRALPQVRIAPNLADYHEGCSVLGDALNRLGRRLETIAALEACAAIQPAFLPSGQFNSSAWMRLRLRLAEEYRGAGRLQDAKVIEHDLRTLLQFADADHPLVMRLNQRD